MATKKGLTINFFPPLSFVPVFGSGIRDPEWIIIRIRDKHPGSATLGSVRVPPALDESRHRCSCPGCRRTCSPSALARKSPTGKSDLQLESVKKYIRSLAE